jgi:hypothetical protein
MRVTTILLWRAGVMLNCLAACSSALFSSRRFDSPEGAKKPTLAAVIDAPAGHHSSALPTGGHPLRLLPVRAHVDLPAVPTALAAFDGARKPRHFDIVGILRHVDQRLMAAGHR